MACIATKIFCGSNVEKLTVFVFLTSGKFCNDLADSDLCVFLLQEGKQGKLVAYTEATKEQVCSNLSLFCCRDKVCLPTAANLYRSVWFDVSI